MNRKLLVHYLKYIILPGILFFLIILFVISVYFELQLEQSGSTSVVNTTTMETISNSGVLIISDYDWKVNGVSVKSDKYIPGDCSPSRNVESRIDIPCNAKFGDTVYAHVTLTSPKHDYENYVYLIIIIDDGKCFSNDFYTKLKETNHIQCDRAIISSHSSDINTSGDSRRLGINTKINEGESKEFVYYFPVDPFINDHGTYFMLISYVNQDNIVEYIEIDKRHGIKI